AIDRAIEARSKRSIAALIACSFACYFMHILDWILLFVCGAALLLSLGRAWRRGRVVLWAFVPSTLFMLWNFIFAAGTNRMVKPELYYFNGIWHPIENVGYFWQRLLVYWDSASFLLILAGLGASWVALAWRADWRSGVRGGHLRFAPEVCCAA